MVSKQKQTLDAYIRVGVFLEQHPVTGPLTYAGPREVLADVVQRLREFSSAQVSGRVLSRKETSVQARLVQRIVQRHMRPIVAIARRQLDAEAEVQLPSALRLPKVSERATRILLACDGMIEAVRPFEARFVASGLPADFLAQFIAARDELAAALGGRAAHIGTQVGATRGMAVQMRRGRDAVERLDAIVRASFDGDEVTLTRWRAARRVQLVPGGAGTRGDDVPPEAQAA